jgi:hypothetical protein
LIDTEIPMADSAATRIMVPLQATNASTANSAGSLPRGLVLALPAEPLVMAWIEQ